MAVAWGKLGNCVRQKRRDAVVYGMGVREAAKQSGVSSAAISRIENGKACTADTYLKICKWLGADPKDFSDES